MKKNKFVIVGLGSIGQELLGKISTDMVLVCIDLNPDLEDTAHSIRSDCTFVTGDATSRLILEYAGVAEADGVIVTTRDEKVNIETARIINEHFDSKRVIAVGVTKESLKTLEALGAEVENIFTVSAAAIRNRIEQTSRAAHAIGLGKNEILEVDVHPNSRLANRPLRSLTPARWRIGIIYRDDNIVVPGKDTVLKPKDRVVILGDPAVLKTVSEMLTFKFEQFPLEYGSAAIAYLHGNETEEFFQELDYLFSVLSLARIIWVFSKKSVSNEAGFREYMQKENLKNMKILETDSTPLKAVQEAVQELRGDAGLVAMPRNALPRSFLPLVIEDRGKAYLRSMIHTVNCPVLLTGGTFPYAQTVVPCVNPENLQYTLETALEISASLNNEVTALLVNPSRYISTGNDMQAFEAIKKTINEVSTMHKVGINKKHLVGNPVKAVTRILSGFNLLIVDSKGWKQQTILPPFLNPDTVWHIIRKSTISTLLLPPVEEYL